ncbi:MAG TPA: methyltransferase domain-containing protein [Ktedonobacteraceae bacterium]|nr:methyltransferase domain-containing protein [Ktedonobacteraceae bacterium]
MKVKQQLADMWDRQHRCPDGIVGWLVGERMGRQHRPETTWTVDLLDIQPTDTVLEIGFGAGQGIKLAAAQACEGHVMGIDLSEDMVRVARRRNAQAARAGRVMLSQGSITALPFEDQQFDKIMTIHTVYFWSESLQAFSELYRVLKPGGRAVITLCTGKINERGEVEVWSSFQSMLEERVIPGMQQVGFKDVRQERGPDSRQYTNVAVIGEK